MTQLIIDGLPNLKMVDLSMAMLNNQMFDDFDPSLPTWNRPQGPKKKGCLGSQESAKWLKTSYPKP